ncbi:MAG TPA: DUF6134 family protein [Acetobacteraceae bacterium]|nr:DUF6134 family protein [Acetobacteraceae bacterium]
MSLDRSGRPESGTATGRRGFLLLPLGVVPRPARAAEGDYAFRILRRGEVVGRHEVRFARRGAVLAATSELRIAAGFLGVVLYRYEHRYEEVTEGGRFLRVSSRLNRNGRIVEVRAEAVPGAVLVDGTEGAQRLPADAAPLSWWERGRMGGRVPLFGTTTGQVLALRWEARPIPGTGAEYACQGEIEATVRFDVAGRWIGFSARGEDGTPITYETA